MLADNLKLVLYTPERLVEPHSRQVFRVQTLVCDFESGDKSPHSQLCAHGFLMGGDAGGGVHELLERHNLAFAD
ncbi:MAG: hypothetical protein QOD75_217 [Blastocatellia bacterium]|jgi:hypothetical protein|nr:hypothetical protein [Blastocatellia bacterium]